MHNASKLKSSPRPRPGCLLGATGDFEFFPKRSQTRVVQAHLRPLYDYSLLLCPPPSVSKISFASSLPTCRDHHPRALAKQDKPRGMGAAILFAQRPPGCRLSRRALSRRKGAKGGASSGVEFSRARALGRKVSRVHAHAPVWGGECGCACAVRPLWK